MIYISYIVLRLPKYINKRKYFNAQINNKIKNIYIAVGSHIEPLS